MQPEKEMRTLDERDLALNPELAEAGLKAGEEVELLEPTDEDGNPLDEEARRTAMNYVYYPNTAAELVTTVDGMPVPGGACPISALPTKFPAKFMANTNVAGKPCVTTVAPTTTPPVVVLNSGNPPVVHGYGTGSPPVK